MLHWDLSANSPRFSLQNCWFFCQVDVALLPAFFFPWHAFGMCSFILPKCFFWHASGAFSFCEIWSVRKVTAKVCKTRFLTSESLKLRESYKEEKKQNVEVILACIFCTFFIEVLRRDPIIHLKALVLFTLKYTVADKQIYLCNVIKRT